MIEKEAWRAEAANAVLCWLATVSAAGVPNVSPKEMFCAYGADALVIADIASPISVRNVRANPSVCVSYIDIFRQRGFKLVGQGRVLAPDDPEYRTHSAPLIAKVGDAFPIRHVIVVNIDHITPIRAPSYSFQPHRTEDMHMAAAYERYGVRPSR